jgi:hypothetical protein
MVDPVGADPGQEWVEVHNPLGRPLELAGLTLYRRSPDGSGLRSVALTDGGVPAHGQLVFGATAAGPWVDSEAGAALAPLDNARGVVGVRCGEVALDEVAWTRPAAPGRSWMRSGGSAPGWCDAPAGLLYDGRNSGTPGGPNPACPDATDGGTACLEEGRSRPVAHPRPGELVLTEVMASPAAASDAAGEWLEVLALADVDLNGVTVANGAGGADVLESPRCLAVGAGQRAVLARSADPFLNGGLPPPLATFRVPLSNQNERVQLRLGDAGLDEAQLLASSPGRAWQLDPAAGAARRFCLAPRAWRPDGGGDLGSPGAPNPACPGASPGEPPPPSEPAATLACVDLGSGRLRPPRAPAAGQATLSEVLADPSAASDAAGEFVEVRFAREADLNGLGLRTGAGATATFVSAVCQTVAAGTHAVFARSRDWRLNGGLPLVAGLFSFSVRNGADRLELLAPDGGVLDTLAWTVSRPGVSLQVQGGRTCFTPDASANHFGFGDLGTPGRPNPPCP